MDIGGEGGEVGRPWRRRRLRRPGNGAGRREDAGGVREDGGRLGGWEEAERRMRRLCRHGYWWGGWGGWGGRGGAEVEEAGEAGEAGEGAGRPGGGGGREAALQGEAAGPEPSTTPLLTQYS